jgi:LysR family transcriptional regulator for bpeEF and oprC
VPLLGRTTRSLALTLDGRAFHERCLRILEELREAREGLARTGREPAGVLRVDTAIALGHGVIAPRVPAFLQRHPKVRLELTLRDQQIDPAAEGVDVLVRIGELRDSTLLARRLGETRTVLCASPAYLRRRGVPRAPRDLAEHDCVGYLRDGRPADHRFPVGDRFEVVEIAGRFHANDAGLLREAAIAGLGVVALFDFLVIEALARGELVAVLEDHPVLTRAIHALYPRNRQLLPKVQAFLEFLEELFAPHGGHHRPRITRGRR